MSLEALLFSLVCGVAGYVVGSIPFGWVIVKVLKGEDIRTYGSGRSGGTNVMRAAGKPAGFATAILDVLKGMVMVWVCRELGRNIPGAAGWPEALAGAAAVFGHCASLFLNFRGGAGGATATGTSIAMWLAGGVPAMLLGAFVWLVIGYASLGTLTVGACVALGFAIGAVMGLVPAAYAFYGAAILGIVLIALRPNLARLRAGTEPRKSIFERF
jgi:glycerol-3-phosphate acyltransferase PlsY